MNKSVRNELLDQLISLDEEVVNKALGKLRKSGDHTFVAPLMNTMANSDNELIVASIGQLFFDLKDKPAVDVMLDLLPEPTYKEVRRLLLESVWQSGLDVSHRLNSIIDLALSGNYQECLECLTIVENMDPVPEVKMLDAAIEKIKAHQLEDVTETEDLLWAMLEVLERFKD